MYCGLGAASEVFLIFTTQLYQYFCVFLLFASVCDTPEVLPSKYSKTAILHAAHFKRVVNTYKTPRGSGEGLQPFRWNRPSVAPADHRNDDSGGWGGGGNPALSKWSSGFNSRLVLGPPGV